MLLGDESRSNSSDITKREIIIEWIDDTFNCCRVNGQTFMSYKHVGSVANN